MSVTCSNDDCENNTDDEYPLCDACTHRHCKEELRAALAKLSSVAELAQMLADAIDEHCDPGSEWVRNIQEKVDALNLSLSTTEPSGEGE